MASPYSPNDEQWQQPPSEPPGEDELRQQPHSEPPGVRDFREDEQWQQPHSELPEDFWEDDFMLKYRLIDEAIRANDFERLKDLVKEKGWGQRANLSAEPLLSVVIGYGKIELAMKMLNVMHEGDLMVWNLDDDTALHVAAANGEVKVVEALVKKCKDLITKTNKKQETPLHKAALNGEEDVFWKLVQLQRQIVERNIYESNIYQGDEVEEQVKRSTREKVERRTEDGSTVLHYAIMGNNPGLATEIARQCPYLINSRNLAAATPLQLVLTIPEGFKSRLQLGLLGSFIYDFIPLDAHKRGGDEESKKPSEQLHDEEKPCMTSRDKFPPNYSTLFYLFKRTLVPAGRWIQLTVFNVLKNLSASIQSLHLNKENHRQTAELIDFLATYRGYWDFFLRGGGPLGRGEESSRWSTSPLNNNPEMGFQEFMNILTQQKQSANNCYTHSICALPPGRITDPSELRWNTSPLIMGAEMGLDEFVKQILTQHPESAYSLHPDGTNVLQVAIKHGHDKIVWDIASMTYGKNPLLPSQLLSAVDQSTGNTILHFAAEKAQKDIDLVFQMQHDFRRFEKIRELMPEVLEYTRNKNEKTAQELFTEKHEKTVEDGKKHLTELGKTCSGLIAAVVFASSFSIPGDKDANQNPVFYNRTAFKVFSHAYVIGLSSASASLVLFLSFLISSYREQDFRRFLPIKYLLATTSFLVALVALLVAFSCNIYLQIYGGKKAHTEDIIPLVCELTAFPAVCVLVLLYCDADLWFGSFLRLVRRNKLDEKHV